MNLYWGDLHNQNELGYAQGSLERSYEIARSHLDFYAFTPHGLHADGGVPDGYPVVVDNWERHLDLMVDSVLTNSGRGCINCSGIWASRHTREIAQAVAERIGPIAPLPPEDPEAALAAFTVPGQAAAISGDIDSALKEDGVGASSA